MDKTIKVNLAGSLFQIEEDAYRMLRDYLQAINSRFRNIQGGNETIEDIESRIAEIFQSQKNIAGVISKENVESVIDILGKPEDFEVPGNQNETVFSGNIKKRLYRNPDDSIISGVCGGIGAYMNNDPVWIRLAFIIFGVFFGIGFFVYLALWIAIPQAKTQYQKRELYGDNYHRRNGDIVGNTVSGSSTNAGGVFNEIFNAIGKFFYIFFRILMILFGITFVAVGFSALLAVLLVFFFKDPGLISMGSFNSNLFFFHNFLNFIVDPSVSKWLIVLSFIALTLPMLSLIYWGIKMIFWFRVRDAVLSLSFFILWVISITALIIIFVNTGVSFSKKGVSSSQEILQNKRDTIYIITGSRVKNLNLDKEFSLPDNQYTMFISGPGEKLSIRTKLKLFINDERSIRIEIRKSSMAVSRLEAVRKAESLIYDYRINNDTIHLNEYFTVPAGRKWSADQIEVLLFIPENTFLYFDDASENLFPDRIRINRVNGNMDDHYEIYSGTESWMLGGRYWKLTSDGLEKTKRKTPR